MRRSTPASTLARAAVSETPGHRGVKLPLDLVEEDPPEGGNGRGPVGEDTGETTVGGLVTLAGATYYLFWTGCMLAAAIAASRSRSRRATSGCSPITLRA